MTYNKGDRIRLKFFPNVTGTVIGPTIPSTPAPSILVKVDRGVLDMAAGETASIALSELMPLQEH